MGIPRPINLKNYQAPEKDSYTNSLLHAGVYESGAQSPRSSVLPKYADPRRSFARLASEIFLTSL